MFLMLFLWLHLNNIGSVMVLLQDIYMLMRVSNWSLPVETLRCDNDNLSWDITVES